MTSLGYPLIILTCSSDFWPKYASERLYEIISKSKFSNQSVQFPYRCHLALSRVCTEELTIGFCFSFLIPLRSVKNQKWKLQFEQACIYIIQTVAQGRVQVVRNLHVLGWELAFWGDSIGVLKRISARNLKNIVFLSKNIVWRSKTTIFEKNVLCKREICVPELFPLFRGPGRAHMGPYGPIWAHIHPKNLEK